MCNGEFCPEQLPINQWSARIGSLESLSLDIQLDERRLDGCLSSYFTVNFKPKHDPLNHSPRSLTSLYLSPPEDELKQARLKWKSSLKLNRQSDEHANESPATHRSKLILLLPCCIHNIPILLLQQQRCVCNTFHLSGGRCYCKDTVTRGKSVQRAPLRKQRLNLSSWLGSSRERERERERTVFFARKRVRLFFIPVNPVKSNINDPSGPGYRGTAVLRCNTTTCRRTWCIILMSRAAENSPPRSRDGQPAPETRKHTRTEKNDFERQFHFRLINPFNFQYQFRWSWEIFRYEMRADQILDHWLGRSIKSGYRWSIRMQLVFYGFKSTMSWPVNVCQQNWHGGLLGRVHRTEAGTALFRRQVIR